MSLIKISDGISTDLRKRAKAASDRRPLLGAMGQAVKALGIQAFTDPAKRAQTWAPRQDKKPHALLQLSTTLRKSIRVIATTNDTVIIGSDRKYAAIHQFGGKVKQGARTAVLNFRFKEGSTQAKFSKAKDATHSQKVSIGAREVNIPARPYLPFYASGQITALGRQRVERALTAALRVRGL